VRGKEGKRRGPKPVDGPLHEARDAKREEGRREGGRERRRGEIEEDRVALGSS